MGDRGRSGGALEGEVADLAPMVHVYARCVGACLGMLNAALRPRQVTKNTSLVYVVMHRQREFDAELFALRNRDGDGGGGGSDDAYGLAAAVGALPALIAHMNAELAAARNAAAMGYDSVDAVPPYLDAYDTATGTAGSGSGSAAAAAAATTTNLTVEKTMAALERGAASYAKAHLPAPGALFHPVNDGDLGALAVKITYKEQDEPESFFVPYTWEVVKSHTAFDQCWRP